jgi:hypothetical protein
MTYPPTPAAWAAEFSEESRRAQSIGQRGLLVAGASSVTAGLVLQSLAVLIAGTAALPDAAKVTLLLALFSFLFAAISGVITNATQLGVPSVHGVLDADLQSALTAARSKNESNTKTLATGVGAEAAGMLWVALTAVVLVFR